MTEADVRKVLVAGWFSFEGMGVTAGDVMVRDVVCGWLDAAGFPYDVAHAPPLTGGVSINDCRPEDYAALVFVCGPLGNGPPIAEIFERFSERRLFGVNLSMLQDLVEWNPFELLLERDSSRTRRPDLAFLADVKKVPVVAEILVHPQTEYRGKARHAEAKAAIDDVFRRHDLARLRIDTALADNEGGLVNASQVLSVLDRVDFTITTRLHGLVLSLRAGIPAIAIDAIAGGAKVTAQASALDWPLVFSADALDEAELDRAIAFCGTDEARHLAATRRDAALGILSNVGPTLIKKLRQVP